MLRALGHPSLKSFGALFPSLVLAPCRVYSYHRKGECVPEGFFSKTSDVGKNLTVGYTPAHSSSRKSDRGMCLLEECALVRSSSTKGKLWWIMSSLGHLSRMTTQCVTVGFLGGVDMTHGQVAISHLLVDIVLPLEAGSLRFVVKRKKCDEVASGLGHHERKVGGHWEV